MDIKEKLKILAKHFDSNYRKMANMLDHATECNLLRSLLKIAVQGGDVGVNTITPDIIATIQGTGW